LGYTVSIRAETDPKRIKEMTKKEKEIRREWFDFKRKNKSQTNYKELSNKEIDNIFSKMFG
jgi:hypothetical protein